MRILFLAPHPFFSLRGTPIAERALLHTLSERGDQVDVLTYHEGDDPDIPGVRIFRIPAPPGVRDVSPGFSWKKCICDAVLTMKAFGLVRSGNYDLVHAVEEASFVGLLIKRWAGVPYVYDMDSLMIEQTVDQHPMARWVAPILFRIEARLLKEAVAIVAVCRLIEQYAREGALKGAVYRLEDASLLEFADEKSEDLAELTGTSGPFVLYVGNLQPVQGIDLLLDAFEQVLKRGHVAELVIIGGNSARIKHYSRVADRQAMREHVHFIGSRPLRQLAGYLRQGTVLVSPRRSGVNTPMKIYSYLDSGRPLLATRLPTHTQVLDDRVAFLVEPDPDSMADGLAALLGDPALRARIEGEARRLVENEFSPRAFRRKAELIYQAIEGTVMGRGEESERPEDHQPKDRL